MLPPKAPAAAAKPAIASKPAVAKPVAVAKAPPAAAKRVVEARAADSKPAAAPPPVVSKANGTLRIAISPWGQVDVDGVPAGTAPPLNELTLPEGKHQIIIRNGDFPPFRSTVTVTPGQAVTLKHKFGS